MFKKESGSKSLKECANLINLLEKTEKEKNVNIGSLAV
jgi:hypothetical protein